jgi:hypothetical protein
MTKEENSLKEGPEKATEKQGNSFWTSCFSFRMFIMGCSPFWAKLSGRFL